MAGTTVSITASTASANAAPWPMRTDARMMAVVEQLTLSEREVVIRFLQGLNQSLEEFGQAPAPQGADPAGASDAPAAAHERGSAAAPEVS